MTMQPYSISEIIKLDPPKCKWGKWVFKKNLTLALMPYKNRNIAYEIDLERIDSTAEMLDWIFQVNGKFCKDGHMEDLIDALYAIFNPQANCCSFGKEKKFSGAKLAKEYKIKLDKHYKKNLDSHEKQRL